MMLAAPGMSIGPCKRNSDVVWCSPASLQAGGRGFAVATFHFNGFQSLLALRQEVPSGDIIPSFYDEEFTCGGAAAECP